MQRIGLSATQRPLEEIGRFVSGGRAIELVDAGTAQGARPEGGRAARRHARAGRRRLDLALDLPGDPRARPEHRSTIVFVNNRRLAERLALRLNELAEDEIARAHHGVARARAADSRSSC